jgi:hypothetical protein
MLGELLDSLPALLDHPQRQPLGSQFFAHHAAKSLGVNRRVLISRKIASLHPSPIQFPARSGRHRWFRVSNFAQTPISHASKNYFEATLGLPK